MMTLDRETIDRRLAALVTAIAKAGLDAAAIVPGSNFQYLTGGRFSAMERPTILIVTASGERRAVLPAFEVMTWEKLGFAAEVFPWKDSEGYDRATAAAVAGLRVGRLGVEGQRMRVFEEMALSRRSPASPSSTPTRRSRPSASARTATRSAPCARRSRCPRRRSRRR